VAAEAAEGSLEAEEEEAWGSEVMEEAAEGFLEVEVGAAWGLGEAAEGSS
jgi:hypothetical protein